MNQVAKKEKAGTLTPSLFEADANAGSQNMTQDDLALPFLKVLGQLSPEVNKQNAKFIKGAEPGMIVNSVTKELYEGTKGIMLYQFTTRDNMSNGKTEAKLEMPL